MLDITIIGCFFFINILIGIYGSRNITTFSEYSVWKRSFGSFTLCATVTASFLGGGYIMGNAAKAYSIGLVYAFGLLGFSLKELLVGWFIAPRMQQYNDCHSVGDIIGRHYGHKAKLITGIFSLLVCIGILGSQVSAIGAMFSLFFNLKPELGILIGFSVIVFYSSIAGMRGVVYTDTFQFFLIIIGIPLILIFAINSLGGWRLVVETVPVSKLNPFISSSGCWHFVAIFLTFLFGEVLVPPYVQRLFMAKSIQQTKIATVIASCISAPIFLMAGLIGIVAFTMNSNIDPNASIPYVINQAMPSGVKGLVIAGIISVIMSSASSFLNAGSIAFTQDILPFIFANQDHNQHQKLGIVRCVSVILGLGAMGIAMSVDSILDILIYSYSVWTPVLVVPLIAAIFGRKLSVQGFYYCGVTGVVTTIAANLFLTADSVLSANVLGVLGSFIMLLISLKFYGNSLGI
ncbi:sodium:solute symporter family protein [Parashewanella spongiae]|uniref:Sodium:solute symporter family protein n=1 Tax=Parashewanella spongiae TaxID=342950 RepID=A0A3A6TFZ9_9GAMM|nr:sodium:solute symporter family protein [Parashewanella spongiae]MCL1079565.1 sodium:solute symporter family protein [Parashewanella spongiae]RJY07288.1 sodium:solute symporter family protein [Parashewanella spongiae]